uniref:Reverse transcriptase n=1 Tax=Cyprinodon variegatus TaxID=28743 RepID=A0A3Q2FFW2_CYPVA
MNVLPRLLYLFQMLPVEIPKSTFDTVDKMITGFIWQKKRPRIRLKTLQLPKSKGGFKLPNLKYYYWAAQLKPLLAWLQNSADTRRLEIEESRCSVPLQTLPFLDTPAKEMTTWTKNTLKVWNSIQSAFKLSKQISLLSNIGFIKTFTPNNLDSRFKNWSNYGLSHIHQLIKEGNFKTFEQMKSEFGLPKTDFYRYLQLRTFVTTHNNWTKLHESTPIEHFLMNIQRGKWDTWEEMCTDAQLTTNSNTRREFKWKVIVRFFRTPTITSKMGPTQPSSCWRNCGTQIANHTHIFWRNVPKTPLVAILGEIPDGIDRKGDRYLLRILLTAALKSKNVPTLKGKTKRVSHLNLKCFDRSNNFHCIIRENIKLLNSD